MGLLEPDVGHGRRNREAGLSDTPKTVTVHNLRQACVAAAAAALTKKPVALLSAPDAGGMVGPAWFAQLIELARAEHPAAAVSSIFDCGAMAGHALAALRHGLGVVRYDGPAFPAVAAIARSVNATVVRRRPNSLDMMEFFDDDTAALEACRQWLLADPSDQSEKKPRKPT